MQAFVNQLGLLGPRLNIYEGDFLASLPSVVLEVAIECEAELANRGSFGGRAHFRIAREVANEHYFIECGHKGVEIGVFVCEAFGSSAMFVIINGDLIRIWQQ